MLEAAEIMCIESIDEIVLQLSNLRPLTRNLRLLFLTQIAPSADVLNWAQMLPFWQCV